MRFRIVFALLFCFASSATAQTVSDSLIKAGFARLALYSSSQDFGDARDAFRLFSRVLDKSPNNGPAHLGIGLTYAAVERQQLDPLSPNDATRVVNNTMAIRHLVSALKFGADPDRAADAIITVTRREYDRGRIESSIRALELTRSTSNTVKAALAELYVAVYQPDKAEAASADPTDPRAARAHAVAQLLQPQHAEAGGSAYMNALKAADSTAIPEFIRDARWIADSIEADAWKQLANSELKQRLAQFWARRAAKAGVSVSERLATHFKRVQHASQEFSYYRQRVAVAAGKSVSPHIDTREYDVDDRAFTYVRYGEPDERISTQDTVVTAPQTMMKGNCRPPKRPGAAPECPTDLAKGYATYPFNQTWVYRNLANHPVSFDFFLPPGDPHGWTLVNDVVRCESLGSLPYSEAWLRDREHVDPRYALILSQCQNRAVPPDAARIQAIALPMVEERTDFLEKASRAENAVPRTRKNLPLLVDVLQFDGPDNLTEVTGVVVWPLQRIQSRDGIATTRLRFSVFDTIAGVQVTKDTTVTARVATQGNTSARVYLTLAVPPSRESFYRLTVQDLNDDSTFTVAGDSIEIRSLKGSELELSDVAIVSSPSGSWSRAGQSMSLLPRGMPSRDFGVYYEAYGAARGAKYSTTFTFTPQDEGVAALVKKLKGSNSVSFSFEGENTSTDGTLREMRSLKSELPAGKYMLVVTLNANGRTGRAERPVVLP